MLRECETEFSKCFLRHVRVGRGEEHMVELPHAYSTRAPEALTTGAHFAISALTKAPNCSGVVGMKRAPSVGSRAWIGADCIVRRISAFQRCTISGGVQAGANKPIQLLTSKPGSDSPTVGSSG